MRQLGARLADPEFVAHIMSGSDAGALRNGAKRNDPFDFVAELRARREPFALATVIETEGSVSAKTASKAVIGSDGRILSGWLRRRSSLPSGARFSRKGRDDRD